MGATIITLGGSLATPNNVKVRTHMLDYPQTLLLHDFSRVKTYPAQANPVPNNTKFGNLAKAGPFPNEGFIAEKSLIPFSVSNKSLTFQSATTATAQGNAANADRMRYGAIAAPYPTIGIEGQTTDVLVVIWAKISSVRQNGILFTLGSTDAATGNASKNLHFQYGFVAGVMNVFFAGVEITSGPQLAFEYDKWTQFALYGRNEGYNGKTRLGKIYKNGVAVQTKATGFPAAMLASNNTVPVEIGHDLDGDIGQVAIMKGLDVAGLNPDTLIAQDYAEKSLVWTNP
ncbi:hypothetical protein ACWKW6_12700 [Dyadobacter jiangsuensis]